MTTIESALAAEDGAVVTTAGLLNPLVFATTLQGRKWAHGMLRDDTGELEVLVFPALFETVGDTLVTGERYAVTGRLDRRDGGPRMAALQIAAVAEESR